MKYLSTIFAALLASVLAPHCAFAQGAIVVIDGSGAELTSDCQPYNGSNALPDGTPIRIYWDQDEDGPETTDPMLTVGTGVGEWNYNQFEINGTSALGIGGTFFTETSLLSNGRVLGSAGSYQARLFLAIMQPNNVDFRWTTLTHIIGNGYNFWKPDINSGDWICQASGLPGEDCSNVTMIDSLPFVDTGNTSGYTDNFNALGNTSPDVIYSFVAPDSGMYLISLCGSEFDTYIEVRAEGPCPGSTVVAANDNACYADGDTAVMPQSELLLDLDAGVAYYIVVDGAGSSDSGQYVFKVQVPPCWHPSTDTYLWLTPNWTEWGYSVAVDCDGKIFFTEAPDPTPTLYCMDANGNSNGTPIATTWYDATIPGYVPVRIEEMSWDNDHGLLWGGSGVVNGVDVHPSRIFTVDPVTGICTYRFDGLDRVSQQTVTTGLAWDPEITALTPYGSIWQALQDASSCSRFALNANLSANSVPVASVTPQSPWGRIQGLCVTTSNQIYISAYDTPSYPSSTGATGLFVKSGPNAGTLVDHIEVNSCYRAGLECDVVNFAGAPQTVLWSREWYPWYPNILNHFIAYAIPDSSCICSPRAQCCYCDSMGVTQCATTTQAGCQALSGIWTPGLTCNDPCPMIPGIDIDSPSAQAVACSSGVIVPNPYLISANIYNHQMSTCNDVSVSLTVSGSIGVTGTVLNSPIVLGNMSGQIGTNVAFNVQLNNINPGGAIICYNMVTHALGCCTDSVFICDTIPPCPCPYTDHDYEYPEPGVPITMDNDSCNTFSLDCGVCGCGEISSAGDVDWYPILNFGAPCNRLILNVYGNDTPLQFPFGKGLNPKIQLFHDDCVSQIAWDDDAGVGNDSYLSACLPTGNYRIKITGVGNSTGPYILCTSCEPCTCSAPCDEACDHQLTSLQNWWQLDELTGNTANEGVNQRDGSWINSPIPAPGKVGPSLRFNGTNYVRVPSHPQVETGSNSFSLDAWIYIENHPAPAAPMPIAGKTDASGKGFLLYIDILGYLAGWVKDGNSSHDLIAIDPVVVPAGWHLVTMTYTKHDGSNPNDVLTLYRCGNVVAQTTALTNLGPFTNSAPFEIANTQFPFFAKFMGRIDEVELWRRALRQDEVQQLCDADSLGKCKEFCHLPWDRYLCWLSNTATVGVTLCNFTAFAQTYNWTVSGVTPYTWQCPFVPPVAYNWNPIWGPPTPLVAPGTCVTIPLTITAPPGLGFSDVSCYLVNFTSSSGETFCCKGSIWGRRRWCFGLNEYEISPLSVTVGRDTTFTFDVTNNAESSGLLPYTLEVMSPDPLLLGCRINGLPPGENYEGTLEVPMGQTGQLSVTLQMTEEQPLMMYDLMIGWDESGDNVPEFPLSIALRSLKESLAPQSPIITAIRSNGPGEIRLDWEADAFATSYNVYFSNSSPNGPWTLLGTTSLNSYVDTGAIATQFKRFYQVTAVDTPGDSLRVPQGGTQQK